MDKDQIQKLVAAANSTNATASQIGIKKLAEMGLDKNGMPISSATKEQKPKAVRKKSTKPSSQPTTKIENSLLDAVRGFVSSGTIASMVDMNKYEDLDKIREEAVNILLKEGDKEYSMVSLKNILDKAKAKYLKSQPSTPKAKVEKKAEPKGETKDGYDCDVLIEQVEERKRKAKERAAKLASMPKKTAATKNKEAIEKAATRVEKNVEKRVKKGDVSVEEIKKLIAEYEDAIKKLKALLERAESKMAKGGGVNAEEVEHILMKAKGVKEHHCGCSKKKMNDGGEISVSELPEELDKYFIKTAKTKKLPLSRLTAIRAREKGIANAEKYMMMAYKGEMDRRKPISVYREGKGYKIADGNSTFAVAKKNGWKFIYAEIVPKPKEEMGYGGEMEYAKGGGVGEYSIAKELTELKSKGHKNISLNGFTESIIYVLQLNLDDSEIKKVGDMSYITTYARGGSMEYADGGGVDDFKMTYDEMTAYEKSNHIHYNPMNSRWEVTKNGEHKEFWNQEQAEKYAGFEFDYEKDSRYSRKRYEALFGYSDGGGVGKQRYIVSFNYNPSIFKTDDAISLVEKYTNDWRHDNDWDEVSFYVQGLTTEDAQNLIRELKMEDVYNVEVEKSRYSYARGGSMEYAKGGGVGGSGYYVSWMEDGQMQTERFGADEKTEALEFYDSIVAEKFYYQKPQAVVESISDGTIIKGKPFQYAKGGMLEHGLRVGDEVKIYRGDKMIVQNKHDNTFYRVDLNQGTREESKGNF